MSTDDEDTLIGLLLACAFAFVVGILSVIITYESMQSSWQQECVKRGVAHWDVSDTGKTAFAWNEPEPAP